MFLQTLHHDLGKQRRNGFPILDNGHRFLGHLSRKHLLRTPAAERRPTREQLVGQHAQSVDIDPVIHMLVRCGLLRRHVGGRPERHTGRRQFTRIGGLAHCLGDAEIHYE